MTIDYANIQKKEVVPNAGSMIETFRAIGYNLGTALADIIDNSISAKAKTIWVKTIWDGSNTIIYVKDDGIGMDGQELINAMTPNSNDPSNARRKDDLGRFGLGLKTASFSQCRVLTVLSKKKDYMKTHWTWDLDYVKKCGKWELIEWMPEAFYDTLDDMHQGTIVIWSSLDRIIFENTKANDEKSKMKFYELWSRAKQHIAMTFHRFMEDKSIIINFGDVVLSPWDPFCKNEDGTQIFPEEVMYFGESFAIVQGYVLPHKENFSSEEAYNNAEGILGYPAQQGFYVYRGKRLLVAGNWLGLFRKEEYYKLVRIKIDLPNTLDSLWQIDIKKSTATPPATCKDQLKAYARNVRKRGVDVIRHRGRIITQKAGKSFQPLWLEKKKDNKWSFVINRENQVIKNLIELAHTDSEKAIHTLLCIIEESIPTKSIYIKETESEASQKEPYQNMDMSPITSILKRIFDNLLVDGKSKEEAIAYLKTIEPFNNFEELINELS